MLRFYFLTISLGVAAFAITTAYLISKAEDAFEKTIEFESTNHYPEIDRLDTLRIINLGIDSLVANSDSDVLGNKNFYFNKNQKFLVWIGLIATGSAIAFSLGPWLIMICYHNYKDEHIGGIKSFWFLIFSAAGIMVVLIISNLSVKDMILSPPIIMERTGLLFGESATWVLRNATIIQFIVPFLCLISNFSIASKLDRVYKEKKLQSITTLVDLKRLFSKLLFASSVVLVLGILQSSVLRLTVIDAYGINYPDILPPEFVISYGLVFTVFLLIFYLPTYFLINEVIAKKIVANQEDDKSLLLSSNKDTFEVILTILAPVLSGLLLDLVI